MNKSSITYKYVSGVLVFFVTLCLFTSITFWTPSVYAESYKAPPVKRKVKKQKPNNKAVNSKGARGVKAKKHDGKKGGNKKQVKVAKNGVSGANKQKHRAKKVEKKAKKTNNRDQKQAQNKAQLLKKIGAKDNKNQIVTKRVSGTHKQLNRAGATDSHHIIQNAAAKNLPGYSRMGAPAVQLKGPSTAKGSEHYIATQVQRQRGGGTYAAERRIGYKSLRKAGLSKKEARSHIHSADSYFMGKLGVTPNTAMRAVRNRR